MDTKLMHVCVPESNLEILALKDFLPNSPPFIFQRASFCVGNSQLGAMLINFLD